MGWKCCRFSGMFLVWEARLESGRLGKGSGWCYLGKYYLFFLIFCFAIALLATCWTSQYEAGLGWVEAGKRWSKGTLVLSSPLGHVYTKQKGICAQNDFERFCPWRKGFQTRTSDLKGFKFQGFGATLQTRASELQGTSQKSQSLPRVPSLPGLRFPQFRYSQV